MEARATFRGPAVQKAFVTVVLVIVAIGLAAMAGYVVRGLGGGSVVQRQTTMYPAPGTVLRQDNPVQGRTTVHPAPGTVLRQDNPVQAPVELPSYIQQEIAPKVTPRILQDDPYFIAQYSNTSKAPCPSESHVVVWYSARTSGCIQD